MVLRVFVILLASLCEGGGPAGPEGENLAAIRNISDNGKVLSPTACGRSPLAERAKRDKEMFTMACTTILVGKNASYDGSTMIARNDDSGSGHFTAKKFTVFQPQDYPAVYKSVISGVEIPLPGSGLRITAVPNAVEGKGLWAASGVNAANVGTSESWTL